MYYTGSSLLDYSFYQEIKATVWGRHWREAFKSTFYKTYSRIPGVEEPPGRLYSSERNYNQRPQPSGVFHTEGLTWYLGSWSLAWGNDPPEELWEEMLLSLLLLLAWRHLADILTGTSSVSWVKRNGQGKVLLNASGLLDTGPLWKHVSRCARVAQEARSFYFSFNGDKKCGPRECITLRGRGECRRRERGRRWGVTREHFILLKQCDCYLHLHSRFKIIDELWSVFIIRRRLALSRRDL